MPNPDPQAAREAAESVPMIPKKYIRKRETIERIEVVGPQSEGDSVLATLHAEGWSGKRIGPYCDKKIWPKVDGTRFLFVMERTKPE
jgi:hypothetical protein